MQIHPACGMRKSKLALVQINLGNLCNQACSHCHVVGSPDGESNMGQGTARKIIEKLLTLDVGNIEFTGGAPELNPNLADFIEALSNAGKRLTVRTNLTALDLPEYSHLIDLYRRHRVRLMASLPSVDRMTTDAQRGEGVFDKSIRVLKRLNDAGYGNGLGIDLVHNPPEGALPSDVSSLERQFRERLGRDFGIAFNSLIAITNMPINRFHERLLAEGKLAGYMQALRDGFNPDTLRGLMCRELVDVDYEGYVYDCDFNLAMGRRVKGYEGAKFWEIDFSGFSPEISCDEHCWACTAAKGSG